MPRTLLSGWTDLMSCSSPLIHSHYLNCSSGSHRVLSCLGRRWVCANNTVSMMPSPNWFHKKLITSFIWAQFQILNLPSQSLAFYCQWWLSTLWLHAEDREELHLSLSWYTQDLCWARRLWLDLSSRLVWMAQRQQ